MVFFYTPPPKKKLRKYELWNIIINNHNLLLSFYLRNIGFKISFIEWTELWDVLLKCWKKFLSSVLQVIQFLVFIEIITEIEAFGCHCAGACFSSKFKNNNAICHLIYQSNFLGKVSFLQCHRINILSFAQGCGSLKIDVKKGQMKRLRRIKVNN